MPELDIQAILRELVEGGVEFLLIGGVASVGNQSLKIVSYEDLVRLKELAGRPEDLADLQRLREARES